MAKKRIALLCAFLFLLGILGGCGKKQAPDVVDVSKAEYTYEEMEEDLFLLQQYYPDLLRVNSAGKTLDGREIYYAEFGEANASRRIMINAGIHGREYMTPLIVMDQLEYYLANYDALEKDGKSFGKRMKGIAFCIVPMINPDGITISQKGLEGLRSEVLREQVLTAYENDKKYGGYDQHYSDLSDYLVKWKANARGVDLNRNFGIDGWLELRTGVTYPSSQKYKGEAPNSEPETQALMALTQSLEGLLCSISVHSQGEILYWDCGQTGEVRNQTVALVETIRGVNGYRPQDRFVQADASYNDWCVLNLGVPSVNIETGTGSCPLPIEQFEIIRGQNLSLWDALVQAYHE